MNAIDTLKQQLAKAVKHAVELDGSLDQFAGEARKFWCNQANELLDALEALGEDPEELLAAIDV
jgi:hypothetical protein